MNRSSRSWDELRQIRTCGIFFFPDAIYVVASARTVAGFTIDCEPVFKLSRQCEPSAIGDAVMAGLNAFREGVPASDPRNPPPSPLLRETAGKTWKQIERVATHITVSLDGNRVTVIPMERDTRRGGYRFRPDLASECALDSARIGEAVLRVLQHCL